jgi:hypothetical protein
VRKIISLYQRNYGGDRLVRDEVVPGAEWVLAGEGTATVKYDGTCCLVRDGVLLKRHDRRRGPARPGWEPAEPEPNEHTGHWPGWLPVGDGHEDKWHREAFTHAEALGALPDGTYELLGPKVQGNPHGLPFHGLIPHGSVRLHDCPSGFTELREYLATHPHEGVVWHHPDGRLVKIKRKDFGLPWPVSS